MEIINIAFYFGMAACLAGILIFVFIIPSYEIGKEIEECEKIRGCEKYSCVANVHHINNNLKNENNYLLREQNCLLEEKKNE